MLMFNEEEGWLLHRCLVQREEIISKNKERRYFIAISNRYSQESKAGEENNYIFILLP